MSPGLMVIMRDAKLIICRQLKIMSLVFQSCRCSPFTRHSRRRLFGSPTRSLVTRCGPRGANPSNVFPIMNCDVRYCMSRAEKSLPVQ